MSIVLLSKPWNQLTPDEPWTIEPPPEHWYVAGAEFATNTLGAGNGRSCLVIGSPLFEAMNLHAAGWKVTYLDIRRPPPLPFDYIVADATKLPFKDASFDAISSNCVLCHIGMGRYGDPLAADGDRLMVSEVARVMRPGAVTALTIGPIFPWLPETATLGAEHRVYSIKGAVKLVADPRLVTSNIAVSSGSGHWLNEEELESARRPPDINSDNPVDVPYYYMSVAVRRIADND